MTREASAPKPVISEPLASITNLKPLRGPKGLVNKTSVG